MKRQLLCAMICVLAIASCKKADTSAPPVDPPVTVTPIAPEGFNFTTSKEVSLNVSLKTNDDKALKGVIVNVYSISNTKNPLYTAVSDVNGNITATLTVPSYSDTLLIDAAYAGLIRNALGIISGNNINCTIGGSEGYSGDVVPNETGIGDKLVAGSVIIDNVVGGNGGTVYTYHTAYDFSGRPGNRAIPDIISGEFLSFVNASLPEQRPVPTYHPDFLTSTTKTNINVEKTSDLWLTFVHEGAGYYNSLGFYKYATGHPPASADDIDSISIIIPNASMLGSGGAMLSGDKIHLGKFQPGTSIGFVLLQNAWNSHSKKVQPNPTRYFSDDALNTENSGYQRHTVLLYDDKNKLFLQGFEDLQRDNNSSDNDFNDLIYYVSSNPVDGISTDDVNRIDEPLDSDGDGVTNIYDKFPNDATRAYIQGFPSQDAWGILAFEDLWPSIGDYDLNDLVLAYHYTYIKNGINKTVEIDGDYFIKGFGATSKCGFGVQLPFAQNKISSVTGQKFLASYISRNANGTEAGQSKAVIIPFDDPAASIPQLYANTTNGQGYVKSDTIHVKILLSTALTDAEMGSAPFNPFLIANQKRGHEIHLPGQKPTDKADTQLFGTDNDRTSAANNKYYLNEANWPWALSFLEDFEYPAEGRNISNAYLQFLSWAQSGGIANTDWYKNTGAGFRNQSFIYTR
jgi:LruC domain-containing protein